MIQPEVNRQIEDTYFSDCGIFPNPTVSFLCIYGSSVYDPVNINSDIDMFCAATPNQSTNIDRQELVSYVRELHVSCDREIDEEVPFDNKLLYTFEELDAAVAYRGFEETATGIAIPKVRKEPGFLDGQAIKLRLALNALTTPNRMVCINPDYARRYTRLGEIAITLLGATLTGSKNFTTDNIKEAVCISPEGETDEMYLGYKLSHKPVISHLDDLIGTSVEQLTQEGHLAKHSGKSNVYKFATTLKINKLMHTYVYG